MGESDGGNGGGSRNRDAERWRLWIELFDLSSLSSKSYDLE